MLLSVFGIVSSAGVRPNNDLFSKSGFAAKNYITQYVLVEETYHSTNGGFYDDRTYTYDKNGRLLSDEAIDDSTYYTYDSKGNVIQTVYRGSGSNDFYRNYTFDKNGNLASMSNSSEDWGEYTRSFTYDNSGRLVKEIYEDEDEYDYDEDEEYKNYPSIYTYKYSQDGLLYKVTCKENDKTVSEKTYNYDEKGRLFEAVFLEDEKSKKIYSYVYDAVGNLVRETKDSDDGYDEYEYEYTYDSNSRLIKENGREYADWTYVSTYKYGSNGKIKKEVYKNSEDYEAITSYSYDSKGRLSKVTVKGQYTEKYTYDKNGNNTKIVRNDSDGNTVTITYKYKKLSTPICLVDGRIRLSGWEFTYSGKAKKPGVSIDGMKKGADYKVTYSNNVKPGKAMITITFTDPRTPPVNVSFLIRPTKVTGLKVSKVAKTSVTLTWKKTPGAEKYAVYKYIDKTKTYIKVATVKTNKANIKNLKSKTVYKFCVKAVSGGVSSASYSAKVKIKTK